MQWPLLDRAVSLFDDLRSCGIRELEVSANFNLAQMYVRREKNGDLDRAKTLLNLSPQPQKRAATAWDEAGRSILGYESESLAGCGKIELQRVFLAVVHLSRCQTI
jgi:hypothetical protein